MPPEARHYPRYAIEASIEFITPAGSTRGSTQNVSRGGLAAQVKRPLPQGLAVKLRMSLVFAEDSFSEPLELRARIVWCTPLGEGYQLGVAFLAMTVEEQSYLEMFLRYLQGSQPGQRSKQTRRRRPVPPPRTVDEMFED